MAGTNALSFHLARLFRRESELQACSVSQSDLLGALTGKSVALVGNARALANASHGADIDAADTVIRINRAPTPAAASHGQRTDWLALAVRLPQPELARIAPDRILWMSHKRKRLAWRDANSPGFYLHPHTDWRRLGATLGAPPSTGAMMIDLLQRSDAAQIRLFGFDFFSSRSLSGRRSADQVPHDFDAEAAYVRDLLVQDARITLMPL